MGRRALTETVTDVVSLQVLLSVGARVGLQPDVQAGVHRAVGPLITPTEEVKDCQLPSKMTDLRDKKMHLDLILWNVRQEQDEKNLKN